MEIAIQELKRLEEVSLPRDARGFSSVCPHGLCFDILRH